MVDYSTLVLMVLISVIRHNMMSNRDILSNVPEGYAKISYHAIYTDEDGMPMMPDV